MTHLIFYASADTYLNRPAFVPRVDASLRPHCRAPRYSGVFEATAIKKSGFPFRATHQAFVARYRCAADPEELGQYSPTRKASEADWSAEARKVLAALPNRLGDETRLRLGKTMVLWRVKEHEQLELLRNLAVEGRAGQVQTAARAFLARKLRRAAAGSEA